MAVPYAPTLLSPIAGQGALVNSITFKGKYNAPDSLVAGVYQLMRQQISPTTGSVEYLTDANAWTTTPTDRTAIASLQDGGEFEISVPGAWTADTVYQWRMQFDNASGAGPSSDWAVFVPRAALVMSLDVETPSSDSRPMIRWSVDAEGQRAYRLAVFLKSVYDDANFDWDDEGWMAQAVWKMDEPFVSSNVFRHRVGVELDSSSTYRVIGRVIDKYEVDSGWQAGPEFLQSLTPPPAPVISFSPDPDNGVMNVNVDATFNLLDEDTSAFTNDIGKWRSVLNLTIERESPVQLPPPFLFKNPAMKITVVGSTYDEMDSGYGDYDAEDAAFTTYENQRASQESSPGSGQAQTDEGDYTTWVPAVSSQSYSAVGSFWPVGALGVSAQLLFRWYDSGGVFISESAGASTPCTPDSWTEISISATSPGTAAYVVLKMNLTASVDDVIYADNFALARSDEVQWTPGGLSADLQFVLLRKTEDSDWEYVWNATRENPTTPADANYSVATIPDGAYPLGRDDVTYRAIIVTESTGKTVASDYAEAAAPQMFSRYWFIRCLGTGIGSVALRAMSFAYDLGSSNEVSYVQGEEFPIVQESGDAIPQRVRVSAWLLNKDDYDMTIALLRGKRRLYIQRNIGDGFYVWPTGTTRLTQRRAVGTVDQPRHLHRVDFTAEIIAGPGDTFCDPSIQ